MSRYEKEIMKLRLELEREEVIRQGLQSEISFARKEACIQMYSAEDELCEVKTKLVELQGNYLKKKIMDQRLPQSQVIKTSRYLIPVTVFCVLEVSCLSRVLLIRFYRLIRVYKTLAVS